MFGFFKSSNKQSSLIDLCINGDRRACKELYTTYKTRLFAVCLRYSKDKSQAEDMLQHTFISIFKKLNKFDEEKGDFQAWAYKVCVNECLMILRKEKKFQVDYEEEFPEISDESSVDNLFELNVEQATKLVESLPTGYRTVFNLYVIEGYTHEEIGEILNISANTSKSQLSKAKRVLRQLATQLLKNEVAE